VTEGKMKKEMRKSVKINENGRRVKEKGRNKARSRKDEERKGERRSHK
jgi:hypothetical protein